jgi:Sec7-like guanine-nucleotide exchange factor
MRLNFRRKFLYSFKLPGEAQKIDRIMENFAKRYCENNPSSFDHTDTAFILAFSLIMLNTDAHNPNVVHKMTKPQFISANRGINSGKDLPKDYLETLYDSIVNNEIVFDIEREDIKQSDLKGWLMFKQKSKLSSKWIKVYGITSGGCLYMFNQPKVVEVFQVDILGCFPSCDCSTWKCHR